MICIPTGGPFENPSPEPEVITDLAAMICELIVNDFRHWLDEHADDKGFVSW